MKTTILTHPNRSSNWLTPHLTAALCVLLGAVASAHAQAPGSTAAVSFTGGETFNVIDHRTAGWAFSIAHPIQVDALGWYDHDADGLSVSHEIGLWEDGSQTLLGSASVPSGTSATVIDSFRYIGLASSLTLLPGTYVIGGIAVAPPDTVVDATTAMTAPGITFLQKIGVLSPFPSRSFSRDRLIQIAKMDSLDRTSPLLLFPSLQFMHCWLSERPRSE